MLEPFVAYEASAGSGKTFALSIRYISLLFLGVKANRILTLTFTNKAANEMRQRIEQILKNLDKKESELNELCSILELSKEEILSKRERVYRDYLRGDEYILTIDKFCTMVLRKFSLYIGLMPDFTIETKGAFDEVLVEFIANLKSENLYLKFIDFSIFEEKKLNSMLLMLDFFYSKFYDLPDKKSKVEFDDKDFWQKFDSLKRDILSCEKLSSRGKDALVAENIDEIVKKGWICKDSLEEYSYFRKCFKDFWDEKFYILKKSLKDYVLDKESYYVNNLIEFFKIYKKSIFKSKKSLNDLSFSDISNFTYEILSSGLDRDFFYFRLDSRFDHLLIDEFQDTSILQYKILEPLFDEIMAGKGSTEERTLFYVGDIKQSIYRFRGGSKELFLEVANRYDLNIKRLNVNYRSKKEVVEFVNEVFHPLIEGYFDQKAFDSSGGFVEVLKSENLLESASKVLSRLLESDIDYNDIALLTFTNDDAYMLSEHLKDKFKNIKISINPNLLVKDEYEVKVIIEAMKYLYFKEEIYLKNLLFLTGRKSMDRRWFDSRLDILTFAKRCIDEFGLKGEVLFEFMEILQRYIDIENFLFNLEDFNDEVKAKEIEGVKILTIHKSKGLEFNHLIVCDRFGKKMGDRSSFLLYQKEMEIKDIFLKVKNRECFDDNYKEALEMERGLSLEDELNALYVAFTRAKESLFILEKDKNSAFSVLNLKEIKRGELTTSTKKKELKSQKDFLYNQLTIGKQNQEIKEERFKACESNFDAINFGIATHYMLEMMDDFKVDSIKEAYISLQNRFLELLDIDSIEDIKRRVMSLVKNEKFQEIIKDSILIHRELALIFNGELRQIDLLIEKRDEMVVIDYKTSDFIQNEHVKQVENYIKIVESIKKDKKISGYLCYLKKDNIEILKVSKHGKNITA